MGRARKDADKWMPKRVYCGKSAFEFRPKSGGCIRLCPLNAPKSTVWRRYEQEVKRLEMVGGSFSELVGEYMKGDYFTGKLSPRTQKDYRGYWLKVEPVFGKAKADIIEPAHIRAYMDKRGKKSEPQANREKAFISAVFKWGYERGKVGKNPCKSVRSFSEKKRTRYINDAEYNLLLSVAPDHVKAAMEIAYLCAARKGDILSMTKGQLREEGIYIKQGKTDVEQIKQWTPRLKAAVKLATSIKSTIETMYVIHTKQGQRYTESGFDSAFRLAKKEAQRQSDEKELGLKIDFTFHDLKAKGISDYEGDKQRFSGHKTASQVARYDRKINVVETLDTTKKS